MSDKPFVLLGEVQCCSGAQVPHSVLGVLLGIVPAHNKFGNWSDVLSTCIPDEPYQVRCLSTATCKIIQKQHGDQWLFHFATDLFRAEYLNLQFECCIKVKFIWLCLFFFLVMYLILFGCYVIIIGRFRSQVASCWCGHFCSAVSEKVFIPRLCERLQLQKHQMFWPENALKLLKDWQWHECFNMSRVEFLFSESSYVCILDMLLKLTKTIRTKANSWCWYELCLGCCQAVQRLKDKHVRRQSESFWGICCSDVWLYFRIFWYIFKRGGGYIMFSSVIGKGENKPKCSAVQLLLWTSPLCTVCSHLYTWWYFSTRR